MIQSMKAMGTVMAVITQELTTGLTWEAPAAVALVRIEPQYQRATT